MTEVGIRFLGRDNKPRLRQLWGSVVSSPVRSGAQAEIDLGTGTVFTLSTQ